MGEDKPFNTYLKTKIKRGSDSDKDAHDSLYLGKDTLRHRRGTGGREEEGGGGVRYADRERGEGVEG